MIKFSKGCDYMSRPKGTKSVMRTPIQKELIVKEYLSGKIGRNDLCRKYNISTSTLRQWRIKYNENGIDGLKSNAGKAKSENRGIWLKKGKTLEEELKLKIMRLEIENARLKKGYIVKGGGVRKEFITTLDENTKS